MDDTQQPTQFNMAIATLQRLDMILKAVSYYATEHNLMKWETYLKDLRRNVHPFLGKEEKEEIDTLFKKLNFKWAGAEGKVISSKVGLVYNILDEITMKLQDYMKDAGLLMPKSDDPRLAIRG